MHREIRGHFIIYFLALAGILPAGAGCNFTKVPQGWVFNTGWSLEFHRMPFHASCEQTCEATCNAECGTGCSNLVKEPARSAETPEPAPPLRKVEDGETSETGDSSGLMSLLKRRGRLGVCATCGKIGRFKEPQPAVSATTPAVAKFHPVPAAPVFCPQPIETKAVGFQSSNEQKKSASLKRVAIPSKQGSNHRATSSPEVLPPPSASAQSQKAERAPREFDLPPEPPEWVFTAPDHRANDNQPSTKRRSDTTSQK
jgi:hypothetical protein